MTRIHDALTRARGDRPESLRTADDVFVSPWDGKSGSSGHDGRPGSFGPDAAPAAPKHQPAVSSHAASIPTAPAAPKNGSAVSRRLLPERFNPAWQERLTISTGADPYIIEQFRRLAATLVHRQRADGIKSVMVASANPADGKTLTSLNLALVLSESYRQRVLLVDGDLRRPAIADAIELTVTDGMNEAIKSTEERQVSLVELTDKLTLLPAGMPDADPLSALTSSRMARLLDEAAGKYDWVIVDSPPAGATADATLLCAMVDAAILVVRAGTTPHAAVAGAIEALGRERIHGVVLNGVEERVVARGGGEYLTY